MGAPAPRCYTAAMTKTLTKTFAAALLMATGCFAAPSLTGDWKLNLGKSDYGLLPAPAEVTRKVILDGDKLWMSTDQKTAQRESTSELRYTTDGKPCVNKVTNGEAKGTAHWEGGALIIESTQQNGAQELKSREVWRLSPDGKTLVIETRLTLPQGGFDVKQVFEKQ